jgi:FkbM family methyltransferase
MNRLIEKIKYRLSPQKHLGSVEKPFFKQFLPSNPNILEAGANSGSDTLELSQLWPQGQIHAFEPVPAVFSVLQKKSRTRSNIYCYPYALSKSSGKATLHISSGTSDGSSSLFPPKEHLDDHKDVFFDDKLEVESISIDDWSTRFHIQQLDMLWLDLQGYELEAMKGAANMLSGVRVVYTEVFLKESYAGVTLYPELKGWMLEQGFKVVREELPWAEGGNVLFVRN